MTLVDTSVWIDHLRRNDAELVALLLAGQVLDLLQSLPLSSVASAGEVLFFIEQHALMGRGIGYVDVHLLAAARLTGSRLWTRDKRLVVVAEELGMAYTETRH